MKSISSGTPPPSLELLQADTAQIMFQHAFSRQGEHHSGWGGQGQLGLEEWAGFA